MLIRLKPHVKLRTLAELVRIVPDVLAGEAPALPVADPEQDAEQTPGPPFLSLRESAKWLCVSLSTVKRMITRGELIAVRVGARRKIPACHLAAYVARDILLPSQVTDISGTSEA